MKIGITTNQAPAAIGTYSQAICVHQTIYLSGQIPLDPQTMAIVSDDFNAQAAQVFTNLQQVAKAAGGGLDDIVKLTIYLIDISDISRLNEIMTVFFKPPFPARTTIGVASLPKSAKIEVEAIMVF